MNTQLRAAQRQYENLCDCCGPSELPADLDDAEVAALIVERGIDDTILEAAVYAVRNKDFGFLVRQYERMVIPAIQEPQA